MIIGRIENDKSQDVLSFFPEQFLNELKLSRSKVEFEPIKSNLGGGELFNYFESDKKYTLYHAKVTQDINPVLGKEMELSENQVIFSLEPSHEFQSQISSFYSDISKKKWTRIQNKSTRTLKINQNKRILPKNIHIQTDISFLNKDETLSYSLIDNILQNLSRKNNLYCELFYEISILLYLSSSKTYNILRQLFPFPSVESIYCIKLK